MQSGGYFQHEAQPSSPEAQSSSPIYIYTDSFAVFKGCREWLSFWEQNQIPVWQKDKWEDTLGTAKQGNFAIAWVASHQSAGDLTSQWNNKVDELSHLAPLQNEPITENSERLPEWLHVKHTGSKDLYCEAHARGWLVTKESCRTCISACNLCRRQLDKHPRDQPPLHIKIRKGLWETWQVDYIGPC